MLTLLSEIPAMKIENIHNIGKNYLEKHKNWSAKISHTNHDTANMLTHFSDNRSDIEKWVLLFEQYFKLKDGGSLKTEIASEIEDKFQRGVIDVHRAMTYQRGLFPKYMEQLGREYLNKFGEKRSGRWFGGHHHQPLAQALIDNANEFGGKKSWLYLYSIYAQCHGKDYQGKPNPKGFLASRIRDLFEQEFHAPFAEIETVLDLDKSILSDTEKSKLDLDKSIRDGIKNKDLDAFDLPITREAQERLYMRYLQEMLQKHTAKLSGLEEASIVWANRSPHLRLVVGGVIIIAPATLLLFMSANLPLFVGMAGILGAGVLVLEFVGRATLKVEVSMSDGFRQSMLDMLMEYAHNNFRYVRANAEHEKQNDQQKQQINDLSGLVSTLKGVLNKSWAVREMSAKEQEKFKKTMEDIITTGTDINSKTLSNMSELEKERKKLTEQNQQLRMQLKQFEVQNQCLTTTAKHLSENVGELKAVVADSKDLAQALQNRSAVQRITVEPRLSEKAKRILKATEKSSSEESEYDGNRRMAVGFQ